MCNNILQYGHIFAWCQEHGRSVMSMRFAYKYQYFRICQTPHHNFLTYAAAKYAAKLHLLPVVDFDKEPQASEQGMDALMRRHTTMLVDGWTVHFHDLFQKHFDRIRALFAFLPEVEQTAQLRMMPWLTRKGWIRLGVHIRRGDYSRFMGGRYFYNDATMVGFIRQFRQLFPGQQLAVFVCGNDPHLNQACYQQAIPEAEFVFPKGNPGEDLCVLSHCDYLMGAPSSFSLVASMYHDARLCFLTRADQQLTMADFSTFEPLRRRFDTYFTDNPS